MFESKRESKDAETEVQQQARREWPSLLEGMVIRVETVGYATLPQKIANAWYSEERKLYPQG